MLYCPAMQRTCSLVYAAPARFRGRRRASRPPSAPGLSTSPGPRRRRTEPIVRRTWTGRRTKRRRRRARGASTPDELEDVRVRFLGRKSELAQALREVRDRETGMLLNGVRQRLEAAVDERERELERSELDRRLREEVVDVTLPGRRAAARPACTRSRRCGAQIEDAFLGLGYEVRYDREVETVALQLRPARVRRRRIRRARRARRSSSTPSTCFARRRRRRRSTRWRSSSRRSTWSRSAAATGATRSTRRTIRSSTSSRGSPSTAA